MTEDEFKKQVLEWDNLSNRISFDTFDGVIGQTIELLYFLTDSACRYPIVNTANKRTKILTGDFLMATSKTLMSISACCRQSSFADANMLIRKYRDDLFLYLFILEADNNKIGLTEDELNSLIGEAGQEIEPDKLLKAVTATIGILYSGIRKDEQSRAVDAWFDNSAESGEYYKLLDIKNYLGYLKNNTLVAECIIKHNLKEPWNRLGRKQNNYTHNNGRSFLIDNIQTYYNFQRLTILLEQVSNDITFVTSFFLIILILIKPNYIGSSDNIDYLESGLIPPDDCQYRVAPIVQEYIDKFIVTLHPDLKKYLRENNSYGMLIE